MLARSALGLVWVYNYLPPKIVEQPSVSSFHAELQRLAKDRAKARCADLAQSFSPRAPLQPPFATLLVTGHVSLSPKILRQRRRNLTAQQPILARACDTEVPAQSTCAQGARWHGFPPRPYIYLKPLSTTSLPHRLQKRTALYRRT